MNFEYRGKRLAISPKGLEAMNHEELKKTLLNHIEEVFDIILIEKGKLDEQEFQLTIEWKNDFETSFHPVYHVDFRNAEPITQRWDEYIQPLNMTTRDTEEEDRFRRMLEDAVAMPRPVAVEPRLDTLDLGEPRRVAFTRRTPATRPDGWTEEEYRFIQDETERLQRIAEGETQITEEIDIPTRDF